MTTHFQPVQPQTCTPREDVDQWIETALSAEIRQKLGPECAAHIEALALLHREGLLDMVIEDDGEISFYVADTATAPASTEHSSTP